MIYIILYSIGINKPILLAPFNLFYHPKYTDLAINFPLCLVLFGFNYIITSFTYLFISLYIFIFMELSRWLIIVFTESHLGHYSFRNIINLRICWYLFILIIGLYI